MKKVEIIVTADGSHTLFVPGLNEHYHSVHGAVQESRHVFIKNGLLKTAEKKDEIKILEIGLGTGLNVFLTFLENLKLKKKISYFAIEPFPLKCEIIEELNYAESLKTENHSHTFREIHFCEWDEYISVSNNFKFIKFKKKMKEFEPNAMFDVVYFDAFAPSVQPEMWRKDVFEKLYKWMEINSILITYCAKGEVKRTLKSVGFEVETLLGPPGKREMIRAIKK